MILLLLIAVGTVLVRYPKHVSRPKVTVNQRPMGLFDVGIQTTKLRLGEREKRLLGRRDDGEERHETEECETCDPEEKALAQHDELARKYFSR